MYAAEKHRKYDTYKLTSQKAHLTLRWQTTLCIN